MKELELGTIVITPGIEALKMPLGFMQETLKAHKNGNWGFADEIDKALNERAVKYGERVLSVWYYNNTKYWIMTQGDRDFTRILLPEEY